MIKTNLNRAAFIIIFIIIICLMLFVAKKVFQGGDSIEPSMSSEDVLKHKIEADLHDVVLQWNSEDIVKTDIFCDMHNRQIKEVYLLVITDGNDILGKEDELCTLISEKLDIDKSVVFINIMDEENYISN